MKRIVPTAAIALALSGCAQMQEKENLERLNFNNTIPTCSSDKECEVKWAAGRRFVLQHSARKIQTMTADFMETYNPAPDDPGLAWRVSKEPSADDKTFQIVAQAWCDNLFGCVPDAMQTMQRFNFEVTRAWRPTP